VVDWRLLPLLAALSIAISDSWHCCSNISLVSKAESLDATVNSIRVAAYVGIGLSSLAILTALYYVFPEYRQASFEQADVESDPEEIKSSSMKI
jgi:hypothetical protein